MREEYRENVLIIQYQLSQKTLGKYNFLINLFYGFFLHSHFPQNFSQLFQTKIVITPWAFQKKYLYNYLLILLSRTHLLIILITLPQLLRFCICLNHGSSYFSSALAWSERSFRHLLFIGIFCLMGSHVRPVQKKLVMLGQMMVKCRVFQQVKVIICTI